MKALCRHGTGDVRIDTVPDPKIIESRDGDNQSHRHPYFCRSDLHVYGGEMPTMESGDVLGHELMGEVMEVGSGAAGPLKPGDRVVVPFTISCGSCFFCQRRLFSLCDTSNPNAEMARNVMDIPPQACSVIPICWTRSFCRYRSDMEYQAGDRAFQ